VLAKGADRTRALGVVARPLRAVGPYSTAGSSLNVPSASISAPSGNFLPPRLATSTLPSATIEVAKSSTIGSWPWRGIADA